MKLFKLFKYLIVLLMVLPQVLGATPYKMVMDFPPTEVAFHGVTEKMKLTMEGTVVRTSDARFALSDITIKTDRPEYTFDKTIRTQLENIFTEAIFFRLTTAFLRAHMDLLNDHKGVLPEGRTTFVVGNTELNWSEIPFLLTTLVEKVGFLSGLNLMANAEKVIDEAHGRFNDNTGVEKLGKIERQVTYVDPWRDITHLHWICSDEQTIPATPGGRIAMIEVENFLDKYQDSISLEGLHKQLRDIVRNVNTVNTFEACGDFAIANGDGKSKIPSANFLHNKNLRIVCACAAAAAAAAGATYYIITHGF
jgi:hypothetical protein